VKSNDQNYIINFIKEKSEKVYKRGIKEVTDFLDPSEADYCEEFLKSTFPPCMDCCHNIFFRIMKKYGDAISK
jgi:hypothetical protein